MRMQIIRKTLFTKKYFNVHWGYKTFIVHTIVNNDSDIYIVDNTYLMPIGSQCFMSVRFKSIVTTSPSRWELCISMGWLRVKCVASLGMNLQVEKCAHHKHVAVDPCPSCGQQRVVSQQNLGYEGWIQVNDFHQLTGREITRVSEWLSLTAFLGTVDIRVHVVNISCVTIAFTLESSSSLT